jgi:Ni,Fe-hydrogenase I cytochrome b subunit
VNLSDDHITLLQAAAKIACSWCGVAFAVATSHALVMALAALFSALQIYVLVRDKIIHHRAERRVRKHRERVIQRGLWS